MKLYQCLGRTIRFELISTSLEDKFDKWRIKDLKNSISGDSFLNKGFGKCDYNQVNCEAIRKFSIDQTCYSEILNNVQYNNKISKTNLFQNFEYKYIYST